MSREDRCYDNADKESLCATLKTALGEQFETSEEAKEQAGMELTLRRLLREIASVPATERRGRNLLRLALLLH